MLLVWSSPFVQYTFWYQKIFIIHLYWFGFVFHYLKSTNSLISKHEGEKRQHTKDICGNPESVNQQVYHTAVAGMCQQLTVSLARLENANNHFKAITCKETWEKGQDRNKYTVLANCGLNILKWDELCQTIGRDVSTAPGPPSKSGSVILPCLQVSST